MHIPGQKPMLGVPLNGALAINKGLIAAYLNREKAPAGGRLLDDSGNGNPGTLAGDTHSIPARFGPGLEFDGDADQVLIAGTANNITYTQLTAIGWVKPQTQGDNDRHIISQKRSGSAFEGFRLSLRDSTAPGSDDDSARFILATNTTSNVTVTDSVALIMGRWYMIVGVWDGSNIFLYVDGVLVAGPTAISGTVTPVRDISIGALGGVTPSQEWVGIIDHTLLYDRALSAREIMSLKWDPYQGWAEDAFETTVGGIIVPAAPAGGIVVLRRRIEAA